MMCIVWIVIVLILCHLLTKINYLPASSTLLGGAQMAVMSLLIPFLLLAAKVRSCCDLLERFTYLLFVIPFIASFDR